ncbi:MAG: sensor histidine kinase [Bacteroidia bacterium]|nr:sensor histidine kinase [Bacteroidia bacterium]
MQKPYILLIPIILFLTFGWEGCRENSSPVLENPRIDSLEAKISLIKSISPNIAVELAHQGLQTSLEKKLPNYQLEFMGLIGSLFSNEGRIEEALEYFDRTIILAENLKDTLNQAKYLSRRGYAYLNGQQQDEAMEDITQAILILQKMSNSKQDEKVSLLYSANLNLMTLYAGREEYEKAFSYADSCKRLLEQRNDPINQASFLQEFAWLQLSYGTEQSDIETLKSSIENYRKGSAIYTANGQEFMAQSINLYIGDGFETWKNIILQNNEGEQNEEYFQLLDSSRFYLERHISYARAANSSRGLSAALQTLAQQKFELGKYREAKSHTLESLKVAGELNSQKDSTLGYFLMARIYENLGMLDSSIWYLKQDEFVKYNERLTAAEEALKFAEAGFQTDKKELENQKIRIQARQRLQGTISAAAVLVLLLISVVVYYYVSYINRKKLMAQQARINQQLVIDLMKEQTIESLNSKLEGQEKERKRVAKELHDTLGGTLAAVKLSMEGLKRSLDDNAREKFKHTQELLSMAYQETRQLSHDMMALPLKHLGLEPSIKSLCKTINSSGKIEVSYEAEIDESINFSNEKETHVYRILQELLQNVIKHAQANKVWVKLKNSHEGLSLSVEDNGRGFPKVINKSTHGMGLSNIEDRVTGLRGELDIESEPGKGSKVSILIPQTPEQKEEQQ